MSFDSASLIGIGTDIVSIARIEAMLTRFGDKLLTRLLTPAERARLPQVRVAAYVAKRFAAKEAAAKALGTGIAKGITFQDFEVTNTKSGCPTLTLSNQAQVIAQQLGAHHCFLSLSDEKEHALAFVVLTK